MSAICSARDGAGQPSVSIVVAARNEERVLGACLDSLLRLRCDWPVEIIVVDDGSTDATARVAAGFPGVRLLRQDKAGPGAARNHGVAAATGRHVAFIDADCEAAPDWLMQLTRQMEALRRRHPVAAVGGTQRGHPDDPAFARRVDAFFRAVGLVAGYVKTHGTVRRVGHNASCNVLYQRDIFEKAGGFRPGLFPGEDVELDRRLALAGWQAWFAPAALVWHRRPDTWRRFAAMMRAYGRGQAEVVLYHGVFRPIQALPIVCLAGLAALAAGAWLAPWPTLAAGAAGLLLPAFLARRARLPFLQTLGFCAVLAVNYLPAFWGGALRGLTARLRRSPKEPGAAARV